MIYLIVGGIALGIAGLLYACWAGKALQASRRFRAEFFAHASALIGDDRTPPAIVDSISSMAKLIDRGSVVPDAFAAGPERKAGGSRSQCAAKEDLVEISEHLPDDLQTRLAGAASCYVLAVALRTPLLGCYVAARSFHRPRS
jgi:hypothetical protein